jgi:copper chaperone CopZ
MGIKDQPVPSERDLPSGTRSRTGGLVAVRVRTSWIWANGEGAVTINLDVPEITCDHCASAIKAAVTRLINVEAVDVDVKTKKVAVSGELLDINAIIAAINEAGYEVTA